MKILPIILAGGYGTRLWPISTEQNPKQFLNIFDNESLFSKAFKTVSDRGVFYSPIIISNLKFKSLLDKELSKSSQDSIDVILEPISKNTAAAIATACHHAVKKYGNDLVVLILPSDHFIKNPSMLIETISISKEFVTDKILTFGVKPTKPEVQYGYIETLKSKTNVYEIKRFKEKPDLTTAKEFIKSKNFYWNSGLYIASTKILLSEIKKFEPEIYFNSKYSLENAKVEDGYIHLSEKFYSDLKKISIDYAVMEKCDKIKLVSLPKKIGWNDVGSLEVLKKVAGINSLNLI